MQRQQTSGFPFRMLQNVSNDQFAKKQDAHLPKGDVSWFLCRGSPRGCCDILRWWICVAEMQCKCPGGAAIIPHTELENRWFASWLLKQFIQGVSVYTSTSSTAIGTLEWATLELEDQQYWRLIGISKRLGVTVTGGRMNNSCCCFYPEV